MQNLAQGIWTADQVKQALHHTVRYVSFRYELLNFQNQRLRDLEKKVLKCSIAHNSEADVKRTAKVTMIHDNTIDYGKDRIRPWFQLRVQHDFVNQPGDQWVEWPLGIFLLSSPSRKISSYSVIREIDAYDQLLILLDDKSEDRVLVAAGTNVITTVGSILTGAGITTQNLVSTSETLPVDMEWKPGTSKLEIINALLRMINYWPLYFNSFGAAVARPYTQGATRPTEYTYRADTESVLHNEVQNDVDYFDMPNKWVAHVSEPDRAPLRSVYTNTDPGSPTSTVARGRTITKVVDNLEATSQGVLDALVLRLAEADNRFYETATIRTALMPHHEDNDLIAIDYDQYDLSETRFVEESWEMTLEAGQYMTHVLRRLIRV